MEAIVIPVLALVFLAATVTWVISSLVLYAQLNSVIASKISDLSAMLVIFTGLVIGLLTKLI